MAERLILCGDCGSKNRIGQGKGRPSCGDCGKILQVGKYANSTIKDFLKKFWILIIIIG